MKNNFTYKKNMSLIDAVLTPEGAAVIFGFSCLLFGILLVLDSKRKQGETQDYRFMQRVYGWLLIGVPTLFILGGVYMKYSQRVELEELKSMENPFQGGNTHALRVQARVNNLSIFDWILYRIGLRKLRKSDLSPNDMYYG